MKRLIHIAIIALTLFSVSSYAGPTEIKPKDVAAKKKTDIYIVQLQGEPVLSYDGGLSGLSATRPGKGKKINRHSQDVKKYVNYLDSRHDEVLNKVTTRDKKVYNYHYSFNGFAARLTEGQLEELKSNKDVVKIWRDELLKPATNSTPDFLGLTGGHEPWSNGYTGEDIVIGIIDSGIQPDHPSLADVRTPKKGNKGRRIPYGEPPASWSGTGCDFGNMDVNPLDTPFNCNNKLIKAEAFHTSFTTFNTLAAGEFLSARDSDGHGSHTATTAGGNYGVAADIDGVPVGHVSGMAPRARIAVYKVCWDAVDPDDSGCFSSDSMAAIDQAVADGVDVINFSIGGRSTNFARPDSVAFLFAADAGVFVATSAGNEGPGAGTIGTPSGVPWVTSVAAAQDNEVFGSGVLITAPTSIAGTYEGLEGSGPVRLTDTGPINASIVAADPLDGCGPLTNGGLVDGNIALVIRGTCNFSVKYNNTAAAGAQAIIVYNDGADPSRIDPITMSAPDTNIPGMMIGFHDGDLMNTTLTGGETITGTLSPDILISKENTIAGFSSRGANSGAPDIIKPDLAAPGVNIIAGETLYPNANADGGQFFQSISGTSMSSPHVAGVFALLKQAHPDWTPAIAKSALMTTARQNLKKTFGDEAADPFDIGAGHIVPDSAFDPGLAYNVGLLEYAGFTCGNNEPIFSEGTCDFLSSLGISFDGSDLNQPSIGIGELVGTQTVTRTVTNVANNRGKRTFSVSIDPPPGIDVSVSPSSIRLRRGESATYHVTFTVTSGATLDEWAFGSITWKHHGRYSVNRGRYSVRSPIAVRPVQLGAPAQVNGNGVEGNTSFDVQFGYDGGFQVSMDGLAEAAYADNAVADGDYNIEYFTVPPGTTLSRFALFDEDVGAGDGSDDLDLQVFGPDTAGFPFVGSSGSPTSTEEVNLFNPAPGLYAVLVIDFASAPGPTAYSLFDFNLDGNDAGNTTLSAPNTATLGSSGAVTVDWTGLTPGTRYLGNVIHSDGSNTLGQTSVLIDTR